MYLAILIPIVLYPVVSNHIFKNKSAGNWQVLSSSNNYQKTFFSITQAIAVLYLQWLKSNH